MASRKITICDLTGDSSSDEDSPVVATKISTIISEPACEPLQSLQNNARPAPKSITPALKSAIASLSEDRLREELEQICRHDVARIDLETRLLVMGNQVSRYHADSESENEKEDKEGSDGDGSKSSDSVHQKSIKSMLPISIAEDEWTPRFAKCENCDEEFDVTENDERSCFWHTGCGLFSIRSDPMLISVQVPRKWTTTLNSGLTTMRIAMEVTNPTKTTLKLKEDSPGRAARLLETTRDAKSQSIKQT